MFNVSMPENFEDQVSTLYAFPTKLTFTANLTMPGKWRVDLVWDEKSGSAFVRGAVIVGCIAGGALLMDWISPGAWPAVFGAIMGFAGGIAAVNADRLREIKINGAGISTELKVDAIARDAREAKQIARLSIEAALMLAHRPSGKMGGGTWDETDAIRSRLALRMKELGFSRQEGSKLAEIDDPQISARIVRGLVIHGLQKYDELLGNVGPDKSVSHKVSAYLGEQIKRDPGFIPRHADLVRVIGDAAASNGLVEPTLAFYKKWEDSDARFYFTVDNLDRMEELRHL